MHTAGPYTQEKLVLIIGLVISFVSASIALYSTLVSPVRSETAVIESNISDVMADRSVYGFCLADYDVDYFTLKENDFLGTILADRGIAYERIDEIARLAEDVYSVKMLRPGKQCAFIRKKGTGFVDCFVYEPNKYQYVLYHLYDEPHVEIHDHEVEKCVEHSVGTVEGSLWYTMESLGHSYELISKMEDALAWVVSFQHIQNGDEYRLIYEHDYIDGEPIGVGKLLGASFTTGGQTTHSVYYESEKYRGFFDPEGRPMKRAFLKAPVQYSRISSRYNPRRFHPILKRYKGHFGTDYAAPYNTPIMAVADGTVTKASYTSGNGNYVKIKHDGVYETQYLHMSRFAKGITPGVRVRQGDIIGYVGSTGLATGPHVCFRFWKNGRQVDHLRENLPPPDPMSEEELPAFFNVRDEMIPQLVSLAPEDANTTSDSTNP